eukprot:CAMPEP_0194447758 /NCGR_PEP_ID=MMETSP0176-20130528/129185_1 /TAXON_ID=216777 /ORGANISM="Proboscia alata, Strain PI-D3" /LENGTH=130 /DNA_ID=CAMNT_0039274653 /DNA_START=2201 /DNA_END=2593 /DNA_ORIENTATION=-
MASVRYVHCSFVREEQPSKELRAADVTDGPRDTSVKERQAGVYVCCVGIYCHMRHLPREGGIGAVRAPQLCEGRTAMERVASRRCDGWSEGHLSQGRAITECPMSDGYKRWQIGEDSQGVTTFHCLLSDG